MTVPFIGVLIPYGKSANKVDTEHLGKDFGVGFSKKAVRDEALIFRLHFLPPRSKD
jgi:hypothetical protein